MRKQDSLKAAQFAAQRQAREAARASTAEGGAPAAAGDAVGAAGLLSPGCESVALGGSMQSCKHFSPGGGIPDSPGLGGPGGGGTSSRLRLDRSLRLAIQWDRVDVLRDLLNQREDAVLAVRSEAENFGAPAYAGAATGGSRRSRMRRAEMELERDLQSGLQLSLELDKPPAVELLLEHAASLGRVNLCVLYAQRGGGHLGVFSQSKDLKDLTKLPVNLRKLSSAEQVDIFRKYVVPFLDELIPDPKFSDAFKRRCALSEAKWLRKRRNQQIYGDGDGATAPPPSRSLSRQPTMGSSPVLDADDDWTSHEGSVPRMRPSDVFFWAVASGSWPLAHTLWSATKNPVRCGLIASLMCKKMAPMIEGQTERLYEQSNSFEDRAKRILDELPTDVATDRTFGFLLQNSPEWNCHLLELAHDVEAKRFMKHPHCRKVARDLENSTRRLALPDRYTWKEVLFTCFLGWLPCSTPLLDACADLREQDWESQKRKLSLRKQRQNAPKPLTKFERYAQYVRIPRVKIILRAFLYVLYLTLFIMLFFLLVESVSVCEEGVPDGTPIGEANRWLIIDLMLHAFTLWTFSMVADEVSQMRTSSIAEWASSFWNLLDGASICLLLPAIAFTYYHRYFETGGVKCHDWDFNLGERGHSGRRRLDETLAPSLGGGRALRGGGGGVGDEVQLLVNDAFWIDPSEVSPPTARRPRAAIPPPWPCPHPDLLDPSPDPQPAP